ncbi:MAG: hypothetical protein ACK5S9_12330 [Roseiflexaceae bacterium]|jgi:hypothetical protein
MTMATLNARSRATTAGELARVRAAGSLPLTITDVSRRALIQLPAVVEHHAFVTSWAARTAAQSYALHGLTADPLTCAITAFRYCPVSHEVIHVIATAYTPSQLHIIPLLDADSQPLGIALTIICRGAVPQTLTVTQSGATATVANCSLPPGCYHVAFEHDLLTTQPPFPTFFRRPGR